MTSTHYTATGVLPDDAGQNLSCDDGNLGNTARQDTGYRPAQIKMHHMITSMYEDIAPHTYSYQIHHTITHMHKEQRSHHSATRNAPAAVRPSSGRP